MTERLSADANGQCPADHELLSARENDRAFAILHRRYSRVVYGVAQRILRDSGEAEDLAQEVFLEIYQRANQYDPQRGSFRVWLLQYAFHRSFSRKAHLKRRPAYIAETLPSESAAPADVAVGLTSQEQRWFLESGFKRLSLHQRETLALFCFRELSLREIASETGIKPGNVRHCYYRGLAELRRWVEKGQRPRRSPCGGSGSARTGVY